MHACIESLLRQTVSAHIIIVENASTDGSLALLEKDYPELELIKHDVNKGYAGGVNPGFKRAIELGATYAAPFNNDAIADENWLKHLVEFLDENPQVGVATCKVLSADGKHLDSTGDYYTNWGLAYPRGRDETDVDAYDSQTEVFSASGAASLYRVSMLKEVGLFDEDFFAYYEDIDLSFRAQLAGWKVAFVPQSRVYHATGSTSSKIKGFTTYQSMKNQPMLLIKNVPSRYLWRVGWRFTLAYSLFFAHAVSRGQGWVALKGWAKSVALLPKKLRERRVIHRRQEVSDAYIWQMIVHDLPPNARALRKLRSAWWGITRRNA